MGKNNKKSWRMNGVLSSCLSVFKGVASGTLFSCQRHFIFSHLPFPLTTKAKIATWDCWCLSEEGRCSHALEKHRLVSQNIKTSLFSLGTVFFLKQAPSKYMHHGGCTSLSALLPSHIAFSLVHTTDSHFSTLLALFLHRYPALCHMLPPAVETLFPQTGPVTFDSLVCIQALLGNLLFSSQRTN